MSEMVISLRISIRTEFSKTLMNSKVNKHNSENQRKSLRKELYEYYYLSLHRG
jgi:hypothetical protein